MATEAMENHLFEQLLSRINQETRSSERKLEILFNSKGLLSALQASRVLYAFGAEADKLRAIQIIDPRLCRMSCSEARDVLGAFSIHNDKVQALQHIKRYLGDSQTLDGSMQIFNAFPFENDKCRASHILNTVRSDQADLTPAGGHQGYAALGGLYTQSRPMVQHLYGSIEDQQRNAPGHGEIEIPVEARGGVLPSMYTGHPSYAYPPGRDYAEDRGYPGNGMYGEEQCGGTAECTARPPLASYSMGGPPLRSYPGGATPTGFPA